MPNVKEVTICSKNRTSPVNVLFAGNRPVSDELTQRLNSEGYLWDLVPLEELEQCLQNRKLSGTVVIDGEQISRNQAESYQRLFEDLDGKHLSIVFFDCPDWIDLDKLQLASVVNSVEYEPLWARIESNMKYFLRLQETLAQKGTHNCQLYVHKEMAKQLEMAGHVQRNFLPTRLPHTQKIRWAASFHPAEWVSGDIYDIARLDEKHIGFYLADAVGHSMPAALLTIFLKQAATMRQTIGNDYYIFKPWEVVTALNLRMSEQELAGCLFATCFYGLLNIETLQLEYARAGHPYPVLIRGEELIQLKTRGGLLGIFPEADFEQKSIQLQPGDKLFIFSDGAEPLLGESDEQGEFVFNEQFKQLSRLPLEGMFETFNNLTARHHFKPSEVDDVTAIGMEIL
jgi:serine phosphatase RsbU (regulator of sigma subunit)